MSKTRAGEVWKEIKPFAVRDLVKEDNKSKGNPDAYAILLYRASSQKLSKYSVSSDGLDAALASASSGDVVWIPATTIPISGGSGYSVESEVASGSVDGDNEDGVTVGPLTVGNYYAVDAEDGPYALGPVRVNNYAFHVNNGTGFPPGDEPIGYIEASYGTDFYYNLPDWADLIVDLDGYHARLYWRATTASIKFRCCDSDDAFGNNTGSLGWSLKNATYDPPGITIPAGVEVVGLGENTVLDGIVENNGILTNLQVTGIIDGGTVRMVSNPEVQLFSEIIRSTVIDGLSPFRIRSTTLNINLNADMVDGLHADEIAQSSDLIPVQHIEDNVSNPPTEEELISSIGSPTTEIGESAYVINDNGDFNNLYLAVASGGQWWISTLTQAISATLSVTVDSITTLATASGQWFGRASLMELPDNIWALAYYEASAHAANDGELHIKFSDDYGETWSDEDEYLDGTPITGFPMNPPDAGASEDAGEPWLVLCDNGDLLIHMWRIDYSVTANGTYQSRSIDNGKTWDTPSQIDFVGIADDDKAFMTDDHFIYDGVIYAGIRERDDVANTHSKNGLVKSEDNGETWEFISDISDYSTYPTREVGLEYIGNNTIIAILRGHGNDKTYQRISTDMGATWGTMQDITSTFTASGRHRIYTRSHLQGAENWWNDRVLICVGFELETPGSSHPRKNAIWISKDAGDSWDGPNYLDTSSEDGGYGDVLYNPTDNQYVVVTYKGTLYAADLKQYNVSIGGI